VASVEETIVLEDDAENEREDDKKVRKQDGTADLEGRGWSRARIVDDNV
jgi:hypothetical protein